MIGILDSDDIEIPIVGEISVVLGAAGDLILNGGELIVGSIIAPLLSNFGIVAGLIGQLDAVLSSTPLPLSLLSEITLYALLVIYALRLYNRITGDTSST
jgi:hypothetical protein